MVLIRVGIAVLVASIGSVTPVRAASIPDYPTRPVRLLVPFAPGGGADALARICDAQACRIHGSAVGRRLHLAGELLQRRTGVQMTHIPYKGGAPAAAAVLAGEAQLLFGSKAE